LAVAVEADMNGLFKALAAALLMEQLKKDPNGY
jgi:hypothetical protein